MLIKTKHSPTWIAKSPLTITKKDAKEQSIRPLRIGFINYMPDKAFIAQEHDFIQPLIEASGVLQFELLLLKETSVKRSKEIEEYKNLYYQDITQELLEQCDILIQSGANEIDENGTAISFTHGAIAQEICGNYTRAKNAGVTTQVGSCFASQVIAHNFYSIGITRCTQNNTPVKLLGVYECTVSENEDAQKNFITQHLNSRFPVIFARNHQLNTHDIEKSTELVSLITSTEDIAGQKETHLFYDPKELFFGFQGHPEYQKFALLKEYLRDVGIYFNNKNQKYCPDIPQNYFTKKGYQQMFEFREKVITSKQNKEERPRIEESIYDEVLQNWKDTGDKIWARIFNATYQLTGFNPGQKLTTKRNINTYTHPLNVFLI